MSFPFLKKIFGSGNGSGSDLFLPADQFRTLVLHECARCDRNAHVFSLIHVDLDDGRNRDGQSVRRLARSLVRRMRTTDEIGWMDGKSVGVFLPETGREGAQSLADDACAGFSYQIYTYPWVPAAGHLKKGPDHRRDGRDQGPPPESPSPGEGEVSVPKGPESAHLLHSRRLEGLFMPKGMPFWKRAFDILGSSIMIVALSPVFVLVALFIKLVSRGPVFFLQERVGYLGNPFTVWKFRTMKADSDNVSVHREYLKGLIRDSGSAMTKLDVGRDNRLIPLAGLLRRSCVDELPQLFNVLRGEMSLVGPRPCLAYEAEEFDLWQHRRFHTFPGMTGLWQVSGKNRLTFKEMMRLDVRYATRKNLAADFLISLKTVPAILGQVRDALGAKYPILARRPAKQIPVRRWSPHHLISRLFL